MDSYWIGPYNIRVHNSIKEIVAADGYNTLRIDGTHTNIWSNIVITEQQYKEKYTIIDADGNYYWKEGLSTPIEITEEFYAVFQIGTFYNPAGKHYTKMNPENFNVKCDMCGRKNLSVCIGADTTDLCMECICIIEADMLK